MQRPAARMGELHGALVVHAHAKAPFVEQTMVPAAEEHEVRELRFAAIGPDPRFPPSGSEISPIGTPRFPVCDSEISGLHSPPTKHRRSDDEHRGRRVGQRQQPQRNRHVGQGVREEDGVPGG